MDYGAFPRFILTPLSPSQHSINNQHCIFIVVARVSGHARGFVPIVHCWMSFFLDYIVCPGIGFPLALLDELLFGLVCPGISFPFTVPCQNEGHNIFKKEENEKKVFKKRRCLSGDSRKVKRHDRFKRQT